jgi:hypothetical protein
MDFLEMTRYRIEVLSNNFQKSYYPVINASLIGL